MSASSRAERLLRADPGGGHRGKGGSRPLASPSRALPRCWSLAAEVRRQSSSRRRSASPVAALIWRISTRSSRRSSMLSARAAVCGARIGRFSIWPVRRAIPQHCAPSSDGCRRRANGEQYSARTRCACSASRPNPPPRRGLSVGFGWKSSIVGWERARSRVNGGRPPAGVALSLGWLWITLGAANGSSWPLTHWCQRTIVPPLLPS